MTTPCCPSCGASETLPIVYGLPGPELIARAERGEVALGGCCIEIGGPNTVCRSCGAEFCQEPIERTTDPS